MNELKSAAANDVVVAAAIQMLSKNFNCLNFFMRCLGPRGAYVNSQTKY